MEVGQRVGERAALEAEEAFLVPVRDVLGAGIHIDTEIEQVADREASAGGGGLKHVQPLDDQHVGGADGDLGVGNDVVRQMRVEGSVHLAGPALHGTDEPQQGSTVVALREALAIHDAAAFQFGVREQEAIGGHEVDARGALPAAHQFPEQSRHRRLADSDRASDADDEGCACRTGTEKSGGRAVKLLGSLGIQIEQTTEREVDLLDLLKVERVTEPPQFDELGLRQRSGHRGSQRGPVAAIQLDERRQLAVVLVAV